MEYLSIDDIIDPKFEFTLDKTLPVFYHLQDLNKPHSLHVVSFLLKLPDELFIPAITIAIDQAIQDQDSDWLYFMYYYLMNKRPVTFEQLDREFPQILKDII